MIFSQQFHEIQGTLFDLIMLFFKHDGVFFETDSFDEYGNVWILISAWEASLKQCVGGINVFGVADTMSSEKGVIGQRAFHWEIIVLLVGSQMNAGKSNGNSTQLVNPTRTTSKKASKKEPTKSSNLNRNGVRIGSTKDSHKWVCEECRFPNLSEDTKCRRCGQERESKPQKVEE